MKDDFNPLVSIVIPVYNGEKYVAEAIDSALSQTYKNIEIIVVNDGSSDGTDAIIKSYGDKVKYYVKENGGVSTALNLAISKMKGEYFSWLSHDDRYYPEKVSVQINLLRGMNNKELLIYSGFDFIDNNSKVIEARDLTANFSEKELNSPYFVFFNGLISGCTLLIPHCFFKKYGVFNEQERATQDYSLWFVFLNYVDILYCNEILVSSRIHEEQTGRTYSNVNIENNSLWDHSYVNASKNLILRDFVTYEDFLVTSYFLLRDVQNRKEEITNILAGYESCSQVTLTARNVSILLNYASIKPENITKKDIINILKHKLFNKFKRFFK